MIQDYSQRYSVTGQRQKVRRHSATVSISKDVLLWKAMVVAVTVSIIIGVISSFWFGLQVERGLAELKSAKRVLLEDRLQTRALTAARNHLRDQGKIEAEAAKLGLFPPSAQQIRHF